MLALEKIVSSFLSLPGLIVLCWGIFFLYLLVKSSSSVMKIFGLVTLIGLYVVTTGIGTVIFLMPLENMYTSESSTISSSLPIVVLGGGINYLEEGRAELNPITLQRLVKGLELYRQIGGPVILTGGVGVGHESISEAEIAAAWLTDMGVKRSDIIIEDQARTTFENGLYVQKWLELEGYNGIYLVTSAVHMPRSVLVFHKAGVKIWPVPAGYLADHHLSWLDYLPNREALNGNMAAFHEWLGILWYKVTGRV